jgi:uncharacterized protein YijF (DUF1287 family)
METCAGCGKTVQIGEWPLCPHGFGNGTLAAGNAQWDDKTAVVVFRDAQGKIRYPGRNDLPTPAGCERVVMRSLREVEAFEKKEKVHSEMAWFDKGSGRSFDQHFRGERYD